MRPHPRPGHLLLATLLFAACPTRTIYYDAGAGGGGGPGGQAGGPGGAAGTPAVGGVGGHAGTSGAAGALPDGGAGGGAGVGGGAGAPPIGGAGGHSTAAACDATSCPNGCCTTAGACLPYANQNDTACGTAGETCASCSVGVSCDTKEGACLGCGAGTAITEATAGLTRQAGDQFGSAIALRNGSLLVAVSPPNSGSQAVLAFSGSGASFSFAQLIVPSVGMSYSSYAQAVAIDGLGSTVVVEGAAGGVPADWIFTKMGASWFQAGSFSPSQSGSIGIDSGVVVIGGGVAAYTYSISGDMIQTLTAPDYVASGTTGAFGAPSVISDDTLLVTGEPEDSSFNLGHFGYVFVRSGSGWAQQGKLIPSDLAANSGPHFQFSVALDGNTAVLASTFGAYVFARIGTAWSQLQKISVPDNASAFGSSVALSGDALVIGGDTYNGVPSAAYVYGRSHGSWIMGAKLSSGAPDENSDGFGASVATNGGTVAVSAPFASPGGAVYLFSCQPNH